MSPLPRPGFRPLSQHSSQDSLQEIKPSEWYNDSRVPESYDYMQGQEPGASHDGRVQAGHPALDLMRIACVLLHLAIIGFLLYLIVLPFPESQRLGDSLVYFNQFKVHAEDAVTTDNFLRSAAADLFVSNSKLIFSSLFNGYAIVLVLTTQKLALRRQLHIHNTLTTKHDTVSAWSGLGSAVMTIFGWRQIGFRTSLTTTFVATAYLATILAFQSFGSSMASFTKVETNDTLTVNTTPDFSRSLGTAITGSSSLLTIRSLENFINFTGLANNGLGAVYNIPVDREGFSVLNARALNVTATYFNVECGSVSGNVNFDTSGASSTFVYDFIGSESPIPSILSDNMISVNYAPWGIGVDENNIDSDMSSWPPTLLILSTVPILDSSNQFALSVPVSPPMTYTPSGGTSGPKTVSKVFALACNLTLQSTRAIINPRTFGLQEPNGLSTSNKSWSTLKPFPVSPRGVINPDDPMDSLVSTWPFLPQVAVSPLSFAFNAQCQNETEGCLNFFLSETDQFVMESLNIFPDMILQNNQDTTQSIRLHDLENVLSRMTAISVWSQAWGSNQQFTKQLDHQALGDTVSSSVITTPESVNVIRTHRFLTLNLKQLYAAFALSILLLALAAPSILDNNNLQIDSIGILQMIWLLHEHPEIQDQIAQVKNPTLSSLRKEGQSATVCFGEHHHHTLPKVPSC